MDGTTRLTVAAYALLGSILAWSRLAGLDRFGYCCDEISTVANSIRAGPREILGGPYTPNNHELFSLVGWATTKLVGESEIVLRLGAAIPFIAGTVIVTAWLHVRVGRLPAVLFLAFATMSPLLLDISRLARGYGLAFLAMAVMTVAALEVLRSPRPWVVGVFWTAGLVGTLTLPHFAIALGLTSLVLVRRPELRTSCAIGGCLTALAALLWYWPHLDDIARSSSQEYGTLISTPWLLTSPFDQILVPAFTSLDENVVTPSLWTLVAAAVLAALVGSSPLLRQPDTALILSAGAVGTVFVFWITETRIVPRFSSFLLVPLLILLATGCAAVVARLSSKPARVRTVALVALVGYIAFTSIPLVASVPRSRRDSLREVAAVIREQSTLAPVYADMPYSFDLEFHLGRAVTPVLSPVDIAAACTSSGTAVLVTQPWIREPLTLPDCVERPGTRHYHFEQYARGGKSEVWIIPPAAS